MRNGFALALVAALGALAGPAVAQDAGVKAGFLTCDVEGGVSFIFGSSRDMTCVYSPSAERAERYKGTISKFGVDIGYVSSAVIVWGVIAPTTDVAPGALAGEYAGGTAGVSIGYGLAANALIGGSGQTVGLQPLSIEGNEGLNIAAGIGAMSLELAE
ncbi:MAG: DUF992 domain-containing protein [Alphaproteobacteria bacterium]